MFTICISPHERESGFQTPAIFCLLDQESGKVLLVESGILRLGNSEYSSRNPESQKRLRYEIQVPLTKTRRVTSPEACRLGPINFWFDHFSACNKLCVVGVS